MESFGNTKYNFPNIKETLYNFLCNTHNLIDFTTWVRWEKTKCIMYQTQTMFSFRGLQDPWWNRQFESSTSWRSQKFCSSCLTTVRPLSNMLVSRLGVTDRNHFDFHSIFSDFADLWYSGLVGNFKSCKHWEKIVLKNAISDELFFNPVKNFETFAGNVGFVLLTF